MKERNNTTRTLKQSFQFIDIFGTVLGWKLGYEIKTNIRFWFTMILFAFSWLQIFFTQFKNVANGENKKIFQAFALYGISISCSLRIRCFFKYYKEITALHRFSFKITRLAGNNATELLKRRQRYNLRIYIFIALVEITSVLIFLYNPMKLFIFNGELVSILPIEIVFIDQTELSGFLLANSIMTVMGVYAVVGSLYVGFQFYAIILNYSIQIDLIELDVKQLDAFWGNTAKSTLSDRYFLLRNICQKCQDKYNYIGEMKKIFDQTIYLYFAAVYISQIICLYEVKVENWNSGYGIAYGLFIEMLLQCLFGTRATILNERLCYILTQSNWYTYDVYSQKKFLILLGSCMNSKDLWIGPLAPLSVITGIQILKSIYTYYTFLTEAV
ncbi:odorant receptor 67d-like [Bradysia coprophila]|uniref:odorant receptor 67d-like n=1 Tax=Bradysia coprophila TaxID=38358 RepID=UPI00187D9C6F|nr:odorant receptor 67d-like [Bradysia coprophila]